MAKLKKQILDEIDLELLSMLYYLGKATATDLEKEAKVTGAIDLTKAGISKRLKWLTEKGYLTKPIDDISTGKLKRIYKAPSKEKLKSAHLEWYTAEIYNPMIDEFLTEEQAEQARKEEPPEKAFKDDRITTLSLKSAEELKKLRKGVSLKEAVEILEGYSELFSYEMFDLITIKDGIVKLTDKGYKAILKEWIPEIREKLKELKEFDIAEYKKLLSEFCKDL